MARKFENKNGFLIIEMSPSEARSIGFGISEGCVCMNCNNIIKDKIYYIAALNDVMDKECLDEWLAWATRYEEDIPYEQKYYNIYSKSFNINE